MAKQGWSQCDKAFFKGGVWGQSGMVAAQGILQCYITFIRVQDMGVDWFDDCKWLLTK